MGKANTEVEQAEVEEPPDPGSYPTTAELAGGGDLVHQQQEPEGDHRHGHHQAVGQDGTQLAQPAGVGRQDLSQQVHSAGNLVDAPPQPLMYQRFMYQQLMYPPRMSQHLMHQHVMYQRDLHQQLMYVQFMYERIRKSFSPAHVYGNNSCVNSSWVS